MTWQQTIDDEKEDAYEEGRAEGASQKAVEDAEMFLREGDSVEKVSRCIGLPLNQIQEIAERIHNS